jgi:diguanylate cyclase (GGDEF)-like protein
MWDEQDRLVTCNRRFRDMYAVSASLMQHGARFEDVMAEGVALGQYPQAGDNREQFVRDIVAWHRGNRGAIERLLPDGRWVLVTERHTPSGGTVGIRTDITVLKAALTDLAAANARATQAVADMQVQNAALTERDLALRTQNMLFDAALNNMSQGLLMVDSDRRLIVFNNRFLEIFRLPSDVVAVGMTTAALFHTIESAGALSRAAVQHICRHQEDLAGSDRSGKFVTIDDDHLALSIAQCPLADGGWVATYEDVTEQHSNERRIHFMAHHDGLTGLPNRAMLRIKVDEALGQLQKSGGGLALLYLDLDKFKYVNDTLGHPAGDELLKMVARRLQTCVRETDVVARFGGDEFAVLCVARDLPIVAVALAQRIVESLNASYQLGQRLVNVGVSIGIAIATDSSEDCNTLLKNADMALYRVKSQGRGAYCIFEAELEARLLARLTSEAELRTAVELGQFEVHYQPIVDLHVDEICGYEALLRWQHPTRGIVAPAQFIPLAEELGLIKPIGAWLFHQACTDAVKFLGGATVAVNLSPTQLEDERIVETVRSALSTSGLDPARLEIEITESALLTNSILTIGLLARLHELGVSIALDDFGTGYSSLSYLRSFPFDKIKIDRLFISEMATRDDCTAIVSSVVGLAGKLGMTTTAEGVETAEQLNLVRELGCSSVQGYLLGRPLPVTAVAQYRSEHIRDLDKECIATEAASLFAPAA